MSSKRSPTANYSSYQQHPVENDPFLTPVTLKDSAHEEIKTYSFFEANKGMLFDGPLNMLLVCVPLGLVSFYIRWPDLVTFIFALLALAPLAERLGFVTEQIAIHTNDTVGGLLNATFGNATELIVSISALSRGLYRLVKLSLLGSILSNMLLVLGTAFLCGGMRHKVQTFGTISSQINSTLLILSTMGILFPTMLQFGGQSTIAGELLLSRLTSIVLIILYVAYIYFQLVTHKDLFESSEPNAADEEHGYHGISKEEARELRATIDAMNSKADTMITVDNSPAPVERGIKRSDSTGLYRKSLRTNLKDLKLHFSFDENDTIAPDEEEEEEDILGLKYGLMWLAIIAVLIAILSDALSATIESAAESAGISSIFLAAIILPIVGNAAEHAGAVIFAMKGKLDLSLGVAIGSSTQIALLVLPALVVMGWCMQKDMDLLFGGYESSTVLLSVLIVTFATKDGSSNWLLGLCLIAAYFLVSFGFAVHKEQKL